MLDHRRINHVMVRLNDAEMDICDRLAASTGLRRSALLRAAMLRFALDRGLELPQPKQRPARKPKKA